MAILGNTTINGSLNINGVPVIPGESSGETGVWKGSVSVAAEEAAKTVTLSDDSYTPQAGDVFFIKFINGNTASNPTLNINGKGAKPIYLGSTGTRTLGFLSQGTTLMLHYDGSYYRTSLDAATVNGFTVSKSVPADAKFTDTVYTLTKEEVENVLTGVISSHSHPNSGVLELKAISAGIPNGQFVHGDLYYDTLDKKIYKYSDKQWVYYTNNPTLWSSLWPKVERTDGNLGIEYLEEAYPAMSLSSGTYGRTSSPSGLWNGDIFVVSTGNWVFEADPELGVTYFCNGVMYIYNGTTLVPAGNSSILYVTCTTPGSTTAKEVVDASRAPVAGDIVIVTFTNGNSVSNPTLNINSSGAKNIRLGTTNASTTTMTVGAGGVVPLYFDGTYYNMFGSYRTSDANSYDRMYHSVAKQMGETLYRYKLILEGIDGKFYPIVTTNQTSATLVQKTPTNATLKIGGNILYYNTTTTVAVDGTVSNTYSEISTANMVYSFNQNGGYQLQRPIYLIGIPQANGGYKLDSNYYTQDLPTTEDGKIYIQLGLVYAENSLRLEIGHPIYEFKDGKVRPYIAEHTHDYMSVAMTQAEVDAGTGTTARLITPKLLVDNFSKTTHAHSDYAPISHANNSTIHVSSVEKAIWSSKEPAFIKNTAFNKDFGNTAGTVCEGNDPRLSDARTPTTHMHTKSQITDFPTIPTIPDITVNNGSAESGKYISQIAVDTTDKHKLIVTKADLPTGFERPTIELKVASLTTLTELEKLTIKNQLSSLIVDDKIDGTKFDDIVLVTTTDLTRLHYSSIYYYVANPQITVIFETQNTKYRLNVPVVQYTYSTLTSTTTTIPTISINITADATSDTKTASPKAVKTYVDNVLGDIETLLGGI